MKRLYATATNYSCLMGTLATYFSRGDMTQGAFPLRHTAEDCIAAVMVEIRCGALVQAPATPSWMRAG
jgi:hypothetical protein